MQRYARYTATVDDTPLPKSHQVRAARTVAMVSTATDDSSGFLSPGNLAKRIEKDLFFSPRSANLRKKGQINGRLQGMGQKTEWGGGGSVWLYPGTGNDKQKQAGEAKGSA